MAKERVKAVPLTEEEYESIKAHIYEGKALPSDLIEKMGLDPQKLRLHTPESTIKGNLKKPVEYKPSSVTMSPRDIMEYHIMMILQSYAIFGQPCAIVGNPNGFSVITQGITMNLLDTAVRDENLDFVFFTDGRNFTQLK